MGIHVHVKGRPDACGCCAVKEKLDALWDRSSGAVTSINGISPDGLGRITLELLEEAAVQGIIDDYIDPMRDTVNALSIQVQGFAPVFDDYSEIRRQVEDVIPEEIDSVHDYAAAIADDLLNNYITGAVLASTYATRDELAGLATREDIQNVVNGYVFKQGTSTPQVISGSGGLQIAGDLAVGGDVTASENTTLHFDNVDLMEVAGMTIKREGGITKLSNSNGITINGVNENDLVTLNTTQAITGTKTLTNITTFNNDVVIRRQLPMITMESTTNYNAGVFRYKRSDTELVEVATINTTGLKNSVAFTSGDVSTRFVDKAYVESTDGVTNNLLHTIGDESYSGKKTLVEGNFGPGLVIKNTTDHRDLITTGRNTPFLLVRDAEDRDVARLTVTHEGNRRAITFRIYKSDGTSVDQKIMEVIE